MLRFSALLSSRVRQSLLAERTVTAIAAPFEPHLSLPEQSNQTRTYVTRVPVDGEEFDVVVIGGGPAGFAATVRAHDYGMRVALIEAGELGGASIVNGAFSSKNMWSLARDMQLARSLCPGFHCNFDTIRSKVSANERTLIERMRKQLDYLKTVSFVRGRASFVDEHSINVELSPSSSASSSSSSFSSSFSSSGQVRIRGKHIVIASGSRPRQLPLYPVNGTSLITTDHVNQLQRLPESLAVIGAGVVGVEYATIFSGFGETLVHLLNPGHQRLLPTEDPELGELIQSNLVRSRVQVHNACEVLDVQVRPDSVALSVRQRQAGGEESATRLIEVEKALLSVGRVANVDQLNLQAAGVELDKRGGVRVVDEHCRSTRPHIYVAGDASIDVGLVNVAEMEGRHVIEVIAGDKPTNPVQYDHISSIMFLSPEVAATGLSERECRARRIPYRVASYDLEFTNRALVYGANRRRGFVKLVVTNDEHMRVLGMRAAGLEASSLIETMGLFIVEGRSIRELTKLIHPHPAICEAIQECVRLLLGISLYKPECFDSKFLCTSSWVPEADTDGAEESHKRQVVPVPTYT